MTGPDHESMSRGISKDMSPDAIARRLDIASQLYRLARTLKDAEYVGPVEPLEDRHDADAPRPEVEVREPSPCPEPAPNPEERE